MEENFPAIRMFVFICVRCVCLVVSMKLEIMVPCLNGAPLEWIWDRVSDCIKWLDAVVV